MGFGFATRGLGIGLTLGFATVFGAGIAGTALGVGCAPGCGVGFAGVVCILFLSASSFCFRAKFGSTFGTGLAATGFTVALTGRAFITGLVG